MCQSVPASTLTDVAPKELNVQVVRFTDMIGELPRIVNVLLARVRLTYNASASGKSAEFKISAWSNSNPLTKSGVAKHHRAGLRPFLRMWSR